MLESKNNKFSKKMLVQELRKVKIFHNWITGYRIGNPRWNGEYRFLRRYIKNEMVVFDVGAHIGDYTRYVLSLATQVQVHCFEPVTDTYSRLEQRYVQHPHVYLNNCGLSNRDHNALIKIYGELYGINSLYERRTAIASQPAY